MKITIDLHEIPVDAARIAKTEKAEHAADYLAVAFPLSGKLVLYSTDFGVHYDIVVDSRGRAALKETGTEACQR